MGSKQPLPRIVELAQPLTTNGREIRASVPGARLNAVNMVRPTPPPAPPPKK